jgi:hypothetical protein
VKFNSDTIDEMDIVLRAPMVRSACKTPILQHPIPIRHLINSRKLQNIKVRSNAADQNEKKKKTKKKIHT